MTTFFSKAGMQTVKYIEASDTYISVLRDNSAFIESELPDILADVFRDVYGHGSPVDHNSWGEYLRCHQCGHISSIEDAYDLEAYHYLAELERARQVSRDCPKCHAELSDFWKKSDLVKKIQSIGQKDHLALALAHNGNNEVLGFEYGWTDTLESAWVDTISTVFTNNEVDWDTYRKTMKSDFDLNPQDPVFHLVEAGQRLPCRVNFCEVLGAFLNSAATSYQINLPAVTITKNNISAYKILKAANWIDVCQSKHSPSVVLLGNVREMAQATQSGSTSHFFEYYN